MAKETRYFCIVVGENVFIFKHCLTDRKNDLLLTLIFLSLYVFKPVSKLCQSTRISNHYCPRSSVKPELGYISIEHSAVVSRGVVFVLLLMLLHPLLFSSQSCGFYDALFPLKLNLEEKYRVANRRETTRRLLS